MTLRISMQRMLQFEVAIIAICILLSLALDQRFLLLWQLSTMLFVHLVVFSAPLTFIKGPGFVIYDAPPDSPWKYYGFLAIFIAAYLGPALDEFAYEMFRNL